MKNKILFALAMLLSALLSAQTINITTSSSPSICYNDGSLTIFATGGTGPYTDSILSGPSNPNLVYPIALPTGQNTFNDLPRGTFTIVVHDSGGHSGTFSESVGGTYEFPTDSLYMKSYYNGYYRVTLTTDTLFCMVDSNTGKPPYQYAISSTGANTGFGPYQSANFFSPLCPGQYWVRLIDSCGNIFTNTFAVSYNIYGVSNCSNYAAGDVSLTAIGGNPPYTYTVFNALTHTVIASNHTGIFSSLTLPLTPNTASWTITDSCGETYTPISGLDDLYFQYSVSCPFTGTIAVSDNGGLANLPLTFTCEDCTPVQTDTFYYVPSYIFTGLSSGRSYTIRATDGCGNIYVDTFAVNPSILSYTRQLSCGSIMIGYEFSYGDTIPPAEIDSSILIYNGMRYKSTNGIFYDLPNNPNSQVPDSVEVYTSIGCNTTLPISITVPSFPIYLSPDHGPGCAPVWSGIYGGPLSPGDTEHIYFISPSNDTTAAQIVPHSQNSQAYYNLLPDIPYTVVSDSGCRAQVTLSNISTTSDTVTSYVDCQGQSVIVGSAFNDWFGYVTFYGIACEQSGGEYFTKIYLHDSLVDVTDTNYYDQPYLWSHNIWTYYPTDTGLYTYKMFRLNPIYGYDSAYNFYRFAVGTTYDTLCPQDSGTVYVTNSTVPFPYVNTAYKCNGVSSGPPLLVIYGGSIPYTVQVPGLDTFIMTSNTATFPTDSNGSYTVIAYDNCGISRSFTFNIIDTCSHCGSVNINASLDTPLCAGSIATLTATPQYPGGTYYWVPGGDTSQTITVAVVSSAIYTVQYTLNSCTKVSDSAFISVSSAPVGFVTYTSHGLAYQFADSIISGTGPYTFVWNFGDGSPTDTGANAGHTYAGAGTYTVSLIISDSCGSDTVSYMVIVTTGISSVSLSDEISIYPNPNKGTFTLSLNNMSSTNLTAQVEDMLGRIIYTQSIHNGENIFQLGLSKGVYTIKVTDGSRQSVEMVTIE